MSNNNYYNNRSFKVEQSISHKTIFAIIACLCGIASLLFLLAPGIVFNYTAIGKDPTELNLGNLVWGGGDYACHLSIGLVIAFFMTILASLIVFATPAFHYIGYLAGLLFLTSAILFFCVIPLTSYSVGRGTPVIAYGTYCCAILQLIGAGLSFVAGWGE